MCGLVGVAGRITHKEKKIFQQLLYVNAVRGFHSTGVLSVDDKHVTKIIKKSGSPLRLSNDLDEINKQTNLRVLMGHNRHATVGKITDETAHPFEFENVIGAHNGTLRGYWEHQLVNGKSFEVDSQAIFNQLSESNDIQKDFYDKLNGAWALSWWDKEYKTLEFIRNSERSLFYCFSDNGSLMYWSSEDKMLGWILDRNNVTHSEIIRFESNHHYSFDTVELKTKIVAYDPIKLKENCNHYNVGKGRGVGGIGFNNNIFNQNNNVVPLIPQKSFHENNKRKIHFTIDEFKVVKNSSYFIGKTIKSDRNFEEGVEILRFKGADGEFTKPSAELLETAKYLLFSAEAIILRENNEFKNFLVIGDTLKCHDWGEEGVWDEVDCSKSEFQPDVVEETTQCDIFTDVYGVSYHKDNFNCECGYCSSVIHWDEIDECIFSSDGSVLCEDCSKDSNILHLCFMNVGDNYNAN